MVRGRIFAGTLRVLRCACIGGLAITGCSRADLDLAQLSDSHPGTGGTGNVFVGNGGSSVAAGGGGSGGQPSPASGGGGTRVNPDSGGQSGNPGPGDAGPSDDAGAVVPVTDGSSASDDPLVGSYNLVGNQGDAARLDIRKTPSGYEALVTPEGGSPTSVGITVTDASVELAGTDAAGASG